MIMRPTVFGVLMSVLLAACGLTVEGTACLGCGSFDAATTEPEADANGPGRALTVPEPDAAATDTDAEAPLPPYAAAVLADRPVAYWRFEETAGDVAFDAMGRHPATRTGGPVGRGPGAVAGTAARFEGGCLDAGSVPGLGGAVSIEAWVAWEAADRAIVRQANAVYANHVGAFAGWGLRLSSDPPSHPTWESGPSGGVGGFGTVGPLGTGTGTAKGVFAHVVLVSDGARGVLYLDGIKVGEGESRAVPTNAEALTIGCDPRGAFRGALDEVAVYDHVLTAARVQAHYEAAREPVRE